MSDTKMTKGKPGESKEQLPPNYHEFFEKKANQARAFLEKHPVPEHLFKKK